MFYLLQKSVYDRRLQQSVVIDVGVSRDVSKLKGLSGREQWYEVAGDFHTNDEPLGYLNEKFTITRHSAEDVVNWMMCNYDEKGRKWLVRELVELLQS